MYRHIFWFCAIVSTVASQKWTEADEKRRINLIKEEERRQFKMEMGSAYGMDSLYSENSASQSQSQDYGSLESSHFGGGGRYGKAFPSMPIKSSYTPLPLQSVVKPTPPPEIVNPAFIATSDNTTVIATNWCFHCATPLSVLSEPMQQAVQNLLDIRRARFPKDAIVHNCQKPANIQSLPKQQCRHSYCQTLVLTEHDRGVAFVIRGCAENLGAIDEDIFDERGDNECVKIHPTLDLRECTCKNRKYCYKGRADSRIDAASEQIVLFPAKLSTSSSMNGYLSLLIPLFFCHLFMLII